MSKVVRVHQNGGPEQLRIEELEVGAPGAGEVRLRMEAIGLNRSEAMFRVGGYGPKPSSGKARRSTWRCPGRACSRM